MILTTHAVVGTAVGQVLKRHPVLALIAAFCSHFILDSLPHWDYHLHSADLEHENKLDYNIVIGEDFFFDLPKILTDGFFGLILSYLIARPTNLHDLLFVLATAIAAMIPDSLQFLYFRLRREPLTSLQKFHIWMETNYELHDYPPVGITMQVSLIILMYALVIPLR